VAVTITLATFVRLDTILGHRETESLHHVLDGLNGHLGRRAVARAVQTHHQTVADYRPGLQSAEGGNVLQTHLRMQHAQAHQNRQQNQSLHTSPLCPNQVGDIWSLVMNRAAALRQRRKGVDTQWACHMATGNVTCLLIMDNRISPCGVEIKKSGLSDFFPEIFSFVATPTVPEKITLTNKRRFIGFCQIM
jgi:hypothetical protein